MSASRSGYIREINGPILRIHLPGGRNSEQVRIGGLDIVGEIIALEGDDAIVQAYESTEGLRPGESVSGLGHPLTVELGPGLLQGIFDGVQRPLNRDRGPGRRQYPTRSAHRFPGPYPRVAV